MQAGNTGPGSGHNVITETVTTYDGGLTVSDNKHLGFLIYPNPATDVLNIQLEKNSPNNLILKIIDATGKVLLKQENVQPTIQYSIDVARFEKGVYFVTVGSGANAVSKKIVIE